MLQARPRFRCPMRAYCLSHLSNAELLRNLNELVAKDRATTAELLAHIAEVDERRLYVPAGYASMHAYCVEKLRLSEDAAYKRIQAARACRKFPVLFDMLAEGKIHLTGMGLIAPHLTPENADELMRMATHRRKLEIEQMLAQRFPQPERPATLRPIGATQLAPAQPNMPDFIRESAAEQVATLAQGVELVLGRVEEPAPPQPARYELRVTIDQATREMLQHAQELLSHCVPAGDVAQVLHRALGALITQLEKRKFGASSKPRKTHGQAQTKRCIPAHVRRAVWARDGGQCTFVGDGGHRCGTRKLLEFDHVEPVARGGEANVDGVRLRCRAHNQYEAERTFGAGFMHEKRTRVRRAAAAQMPTQVATDEQTRDLLAGLRQLGFRADEARHAVESAEIPEAATLEERFRAALKFLGRRKCRVLSGSALAMAAGVSP